MTDCAWNSVETQHHETANNKGSLGVRIYDDLCTYVLDRAKRTNPYNTFTYLETFYPCVASRRFQFLEIDII